MIEFRGRWQLQVVGKDSDWPQRIDITGSTVPMQIDGVVGAVAIVDGDRWDLEIEHDDGTGFAVNDVVEAGPMAFGDLRMTHVVRSKDRLAPGDTDPNDLVIRMDKLGPAIEIAARPFAADAQTLTMLGDGVISNVQGQMLLGVQVRNSWGMDFRAGQFAVGVSDLGRATAATFGVDFMDAIPAPLLAGVGQRMLGAAVELPALGVGEDHLVFFLMETGAAHRGKPDLEFVLESSDPDPDPLSGQHFARRQVYIAELGVDAATGATFVRAPEGTMTLRLEAIAVDPQALDELCDRVTRHLTSGRPNERLLRALRSGQVDARTCRELAALLAKLCGNGRCCGSRGCEKCGDPCGGGEGGPGPDGWPQVCVPGGLWLPLRFEYGVEVDGGFDGQHGPLMFADPWWKVALLILAVLAWLVGLIASIVADATGWGNQGDLPTKIGTVGASNRITTDAALIEFDGSRPAIQSVVDVISGETNANPIIGLDTVIPIDPQVAIPDVTLPSVIGQLVYKSGSRTGLTHGIITSVGPFSQCRGDFDEATGACPPDPAHPDLLLQRQFFIAPDPAFGEELFDDHGDSGSIVLSREPITVHQVVGLLHSSSGGTSPIQDVLSALNLKLR